jgi:hypothetical protein
LAGEQKRQREGAAQLLQGRRHRIDRRLTLVHFLVHQVRDHLGVGLAAEFGAARNQALTQFAEILDDAVMHDRDMFGGMRMGVGLGRPAMCRPPCVADAGIAAERLALELLLQRDEFAFGAAALQHAMIERGDASRVIAAILETLERIDQMPGNRARS